MFPLFLSSFSGDCAKVNAVAAVADDGSSMDVYYLDWAHIIFHQYYCLRVNWVQSAILKTVEIRILQRHLSL